MAKNVHSLLVRTSGARGFTRASEDLRTWLGYSNAELAQRPFLEWIHHEDRPAVEAMLRERRGEVVARHATRSGDWLTFSWRLRTEGDEVHVLGQPREAVSAEPRLHEAPAAGQQPMQHMLAAMARIVESKNPGKRCSILLVDRRRNCVTVGAGPSLPAEYNAAVEGLQIGPAVGSCGTAAYWNVPVVVEDIFSDPLWRDLRDAARIANVAACWSQPILATNGDVLGAMALYDSAPSTPAQHQMDGLAIAARMVGLAVERERLEAQLRQASKMEALGVLAGGVAHDFNNLLAVVLGNAELALDKLPPRSEVREMLQDVVAASETAAAFCRQLLAYAGRSALTVETVECNAMIRNLAQLLKVPLSKKATLRHELSRELGVTADRSQLRQVIMNLITNAAEAVGNTAGEVVVSTRSVELEADDLADRDVAGAGVSPGAFVELEVRDTGCGMSAETQARIFDPWRSPC